MYYIGDINIVQAILADKSAEMYKRIGEKTKAKKERKNAEKYIKNYRKNKLK